MENKDIQWKVEREMEKEVERKREGRKRESEQEIKREDERAISCTAGGEGSDTSALCSIFRRVLSSSLCIGKQR